MREKFLREAQYSRGLSACLSHLIVDRVSTLTSLANFDCTCYFLNTFNDQRMKWKEREGKEGKDEKRT